MPRITETLKNELESIQNVYDHGNTSYAVDHLSLWQARLFLYIAEQLARIADSSERRTAPAAASAVKKASV